MTPYTYTTTIEYLKSLAFDYIEVYTFQRGKEFEDDRKLIQAEYEILKRKREKQNNLSTNEDERFLELDGLLGFTQYLINDKGQFHPSSKRTNIFSCNDPYLDRIKNILLTEINDIPRWLCAPVYRDALVFYNSSNEIISTLNICLSCQYMETKMFHHIEGGYKTYDLFKRFFIEIGHEVEQPDYFALDDLNKLKEKYKK